MRVQSTRQDAVENASLEPANEQLQLEDLSSSDQFARERTIDLNNFDEEVENLIKE